MQRNKDTQPRTLYQKIWDQHVVQESADGTCLLYIDRHLVHEVTSPQAFEGLRMANRPVRHIAKALAVADHNVPTSDRSQGIANPESRLQVDTLRANVTKTGIKFFDVTDRRQGIVHVIGPEQGFTQPGMTIVCGDSHTSTHGAFGAVAFGIGTSEVEHVLATQTLVSRRAKTMQINVSGTLGVGVTPKDVALAIIGTIGTAGGTGYVLEYTGNVFRDMSVEGRMSVCNMSIEAGARAGLVAPDAKTIAYIKGRPMAPKGVLWDQAVLHWQTLFTDADSTYDKVVNIDAASIAPLVTWGTSPQDVVPITGTVPDPMAETDPHKRASMQRALDYMGLTANMKMTDVVVDKVFIGSCTNARIEDLRAVAEIVQGKTKAENVQVMIVPGSGLVKFQAEAEGLDIIFKNAGFDWREPGCSMCLGMNEDQLQSGERCASTSNRNFEGRQGKGGRTHLVSPAMAAAAALTGRLTDVRDML